MTAIVAACSNSADLEAGEGGAGDHAVARRRTSREVPGRVAADEARARVAARRRRRRRATIPAASAEPSVWPTAATCGSVKITRGESGPSETSAAARAQDRVGGERGPGTCPCASAARGRSRRRSRRASRAAASAGSADLDRLARLEADRLEPELVRVRLAADRDEQLVAPRARAAPSSSTTHLAALARHG